MPQTARSSSDELRTLLAAVTESRAQVLEERASSSEAAYLHTRVGLIRALELYAAALESRGGALPPRLRTELNLYRLLERVH